MVARQPPHRVRQRRPALVATRKPAIRKRDDERVFEGDFRYSHIWTIDVESKQATRVTEGTALTVRGTPSWAPDSKRLDVRRRT